MANNYFKAHIWLLETLQSRGRLTLKELKNLWLHSAVNEERKTLAARTFSHHREAILDIFGIEIACDRRDNTYYMLILAALIGMIPESGPHMVFISLFAGGWVPFSVLLTSSMSQDGHTSLPLLASSTRSFFVAKLLNAAFAVAVGSVFYLCGL